MERKSDQRLTKQMCVRNGGSKGEVEKVTENKKKGWIEGSLRIPGPKLQEGKLLALVKMK